MSHCTPDELVDVVDGARSTASLPHLADCAACRAQLDELRAALGELAVVDVPEPPPQYWRQLSVQVGDVVRREQEGRGWRTWLSVGFSLQTAWPAAAAAVLVLAVLVAPRGGLESQPPVAMHAPEPGPPTAAASSPAASEPGSVDGSGTADESGVGDLVSEPLIAFMQALAESMDADAAGASLRPDASLADALVEELSDDERVEMRRLIQEAMRASGA